MRHVATAPHECEGNFIFCDQGLSPYWTIGKLLINGFDGDSGEIEAEIDGEPWTVTLRYQKGGIAPRLQDDVGGERLYEYRIGAHGRGERKANFLLQPRFTEMRHFETGEQIPSPFDHIPEDEGVNVRFSGSNLEPHEYRSLLPRLVQVLAHEGGVLVNSEYFRGSVHEMSNITTYERYVRVRRSMSSKVVGRGGILQRLLHLCATERGSKFEYKVDNEEIVGKNHRAVVPKGDAKRLISGHRYGKQIKHYHPKYARTSDEGDPLYHPKLGVLLKKSLTGSAFDWDRRRELRREIDETLINLLYWSDITIRPDETTYVPDDHFEVRKADRKVGLEADPTPEMEANQETLLVTALRDMCDSDIEVLESLVHDGEGQHPQELTENTENSISTVYRALNRLSGIVRNDGANVSFASRKFHQEIAGIVESVEHQIENAADRAAKILNLETRDAASSAWQQWCNKYAARITDVPDNGKMTLRIDTVLSRLKSAPQPFIDDVLHEGLTAWRKHGRDVRELRKAIVKWRDSSGDLHEGTVAATLR